MGLSKRSWGVAAVVAAASALVVGLLFVKDRLDVEIWRVLTQFLLVTVLGGSVALFYRHYERGRDKRHADLEALAGFHGRLVDTYNAAKLVRRQLKARIQVDADGSLWCDVESYERLMEDLEKAQLQAEALKREVRIQSRLFGEPGDLHRSLRAVEKSLRDLLEVYETDHAIWLAQSGGKGRVPIAAEIAAFAGLSGKEASKPSLFHPGKRAQLALLALINARQ